MMTTRFRLVPRYALLFELTIAIFAVQLGICKSESGFSQEKIENSYFRGLSFAVYILSRGSGVPAEAQAVIDQIRERLEFFKAAGVAVVISEVIVGLEGERKLCARFTDPAAALRAWNEAQALSSGADLVNLEAEECLN